MISVSVRSSFSFSVLFFSVIFNSIRLFSSSFFLFFNSIIGVEAGRFSL
jgi:hypothetical protein